MTTDLLQNEKQKVTLITRDLLGHEDVYAVELGEIEYTAYTQLLQHCQYIEARSLLTMLGQKQFGHKQLRRVRKH